MERATHRRYKSGVLGFGDHPPTEYVANLSNPGQNLTKTSLLSAAILGSRLVDKDVPKILLRVERHGFLLFYHLAGPDRRFWTGRSLSDYQRQDLVVR